MRWVSREPDRSGRGFGILTRTRLGEGGEVSWKLTRRCALVHVIENFGTKFGGYELGQLGMGGGGEEAE